jgi:serine/threonine protein kinase
MDKLPDTRLMENPPPPPLAGLNPADLLKQGAADDTLGSPYAFQPPSLEEMAALFPQFEILELIGKGGMGAVYKVRQKELDRIVALKILPPAIGQSPAFSNRFTREAKALAKLNHPGIVTLHEFGQTSSSQLSTANSQHPLYFILMEYVDGVNLAQLMRTGRISPREALAIVPQICDALQFAHDQGIVHRDIKPENILLDRLGRVKVADFGIAKLTGGVTQAFLPDLQSTSSSLLTEAGKVMGTPQYMAPEQIDHPADVDHRADIYALGVVFYQMLTGELPGKRLDAPSKKVHIDVRLDEMVLRALEKKPELRYQTAADMKTQVEAVTRNVATPASNPSPPRSKKLKWIVAAFLLTGLLWLALRNSGRFYPASSLSSAYKAPVMGRIKFKFTHPESLGGKGTSYDVKKWGDTQWSPNSGMQITLTGGQSLLVKSRVNAMRPGAPVALVTTSSDNSRWETKKLEIDGNAPLRQLVFSNGLRVEILWSQGDSAVENPGPPDSIQQQVMQQASIRSDEMYPVSSSNVDRPETMQHADDDSADIANQYIDLIMARANASGLGSNHPTQVAAKRKMDRFKERYPTMPDAICLRLVAQRKLDLAERISQYKDSGLGKKNPVMVVAQAQMDVLAEIASAEAASPENTNSH